MIWVTRVESGEQLTPQVKWIRCGRVHGSVVKSHEAKQDQEGMEEALMEALKALRAEMSEGEVRAWTWLVKNREN